MIPIIRPVMGEEEIEAIRRPILAGWITQGPEVEAFEEEFARFFGAEQAVAVSSGTTALHLALLTVGVQPGDEVVTVSHSFIATANAVRHCGAIPVFVDIDPDTYNMDPARLAAAINGKTRAILCVHQAGMPCDLHRILETAKQHDLPVVEDAACAAGSEIRWHGEWQRIGRPHGDLATFSLHPRKLLTTGDGGMLTTRRPADAERLRLLRHHGMNLTAAERQGDDRVVVEDYVEVGYNYRLSDIGAAIGRVQLGRLEEIVARRRKLAAAYADKLRDIPGVIIPREPEWARTNWQSYLVRLPGITNQLAVMQSLRDRGVSTKPGIMNAHQEPAYDRQPWRAEGTLTESERAKSECLTLPLFHSMTPKEMARVVEALRDALM